VFVATLVCLPIHNGPQVPYLDTFLGFFGITVKKPSSRASSDGAPVKKRLPAKSQIAVSLFIPTCSFTGDRNRLETFYRSFCIDYIMDAKHP